MCDCVLLLLFVVRSVSELELENKRLELHRKLVALEAENRRLRELTGARGANADFVQLPGVSDEDSSPSFLQTSAGAAEDPVVECQTVCKFVRPNQPSSFAAPEPTTSEEASQ